uniref:NADH dehydrogenase subunit 2 n=1 Tax=Brachymeria lasus TaxID=246441 RepID=UPI001EDECE44|nr:NADH dehydrogenase subunit 2 [Brachymeria lasus]UIB40550.1 NADH dehydrogenase subunit 2 [Brachymeria lasus]
MFLTYYVYSLFLPMLIITSLMIFVSNSWISMWMIMEMNMITFIMMMNFDKMNLISNLINYFFIQTGSSYVFLMSSMFMDLNNSFFFLIYMMITFSLFVKLSIFPFHLWMMNIVNKLNWMNIFMLLTTQKLIPLIILMKIYQKNLYLLLTFLIMIINMYFAALFSFNLSNLKILMMYSSMIQNSWMIILLLISENLFIKYYFVYLFIMLNLSMMFYKLNIFSLNSLKLNYLSNKKILLKFSILIFSLMGVPPFIGFSLKIYSIEMFSNFSLMIFSILMIIVSVISMFFYMRMILNIFMFKFLNIKFFMFNKLTFSKSMNFTLLNLILLSILILLNFF